jgi:tRNA dimethylallyltransferase
MEPEIATKQKVVVIFGPTGVGKTKVSLHLAQHFNGEIISADAMQIYKVRLTEFAIV